MDQAQVNPAPRCPLKGHFPASQSQSGWFVLHSSGYTPPFSLFLLWSSLNSSSCHYTHLSSSLISRLFQSSKAASLRKNGKTNTEQVSTTTIIDWEVRPGGLLVQKRGAGPATSAGPMIKIKVSHDSYHHDVTAPSQSTFGDLKRILAHKTGLEPETQRLLFRGKEKDDDECLHIAGVEDMSKVILLEDPASKERKFEEMKKNQDTSKGYEAVAKVRAEIDNLSDKVLHLERAVQNGIKVVDKEFVVLTELLMMQLLNLDSIEANGEAREQRRTEVHRVQSFVDKLDNLKARNSHPFSNCGTASFVTAKWETFDSGVGSLTAPKPFNYSPKAFEDWELFD